MPMSIASAAIASKAKMNAAVSGTVIPRSLRTRVVLLALAIENIIPPTLRPLLHSAARSRLARRRVLLHELLREIHWRRRRCRRLNAMCRDHHHQFALGFLIALALEQISQYRDISESRNFVADVGHAIVHQTCNNESLPILDLEFGLSAACA